MGNKREEKNKERIPGVDNGVELVGGGSAIIRAYPF